MAVLRAGMYNVVVVTGPSWDFGDQDKGTGLVLELDKEIVVDWAKQMWQEIIEGRHGHGTWSPTRSAAVRWSGIKRAKENVFYYKCGDGGQYDLCIRDDNIKKAVFDLNSLHDSVCAFFMCLRAEAVNCTRAPVDKYEGMLCKLQALMDEEWGRFDRLVREENDRTRIPCCITTASASAECTDLEDTETERNKKKHCAEKTEGRRFRLHRDFLSDTEIKRAVGLRAADTLDI